MIIKLAEIPDGKSVLNQDVALSSEHIRDSRVADFVHCEAEVLRYNDQIRLSIQFKTTISLACSRCLNEFELFCVGHYNAILHPKHDTDTSETTNDDFYYNDYDTEVDIRQSLFEEIVIATPLMPLCSETCTGIAVQKNNQNNLNTINETDPRWDALKKLRDSSNNN